MSTQSPLATSSDRSYSPVSPASSPKNMKSEAGSGLGNGNGVALVKGSRLRVMKITFSYTWQDIVEVVLLLPLFGFLFATSLAIFMGRLIGIRRPVQRPSSHGRPKGPTTKVQLPKDA